MKSRTKDLKLKMSVYECSDFNLPLAICSLAHLAVFLGKESLAWKRAVFRLAQRRQSVQSTFVSEGV